MNLCKSSFVCFVMLMSGLPAAELALAGQRTGNGGDPLRLVFAKARNDAELIVSEVDPTHDFVIPSGNPLWDAKIQRVQTFLTDPFPNFPSRRLAMVADIRASEHQWVYETTDQPTCAWTNRQGEDARIIHLSVPFCRSLLEDEEGGPPQAVRQLIHESTHHVGLVLDSDESFADDIAAVIYAAWERKRDRSRPFWESMSVFNGPEMRFLHSTVWTGEAAGTTDVDRKMLVWGGCNFAKLINHEDCSHNLTSGGVLDLSEAGQGTWTMIREEGAPVARRNHTAVWAGTAAPENARNSMIVFGGCRGRDDADMTCSESLRTGGIYHLSDQAWTPLAPLPLEFQPRVFGATGWTGQEFVQWGGLANFDRPGFVPTSLNDGARLVMEGTQQEQHEGKWVKLDTRNAPDARFQPSVVMNGRKMIVAGGCLQPGLLRCRNFASDIAVYDAEADSHGQVAWQIFHPPTNSQGRMGHSVILADDRYLILWGGQTAVGVASDGLILDLTDPQHPWREIPALLPPHELGRTDHHAFWDAAHRRMVVWGGQYGNRQFAQSTMALEFSGDFSTFTWRTLPTDLAPIGRKGTDGVWTGKEFVVWGGFGDQFTFLDVGDILRLP